MDDQAAGRWREFAQLATDVGPALRPAAHDELVESIAATARRVFAAVDVSTSRLLSQAEPLHELTLMSLLTSSDAKRTLSLDGSLASRDQ